KPQMPQNFLPTDVQSHGRPIANWLHTESLELLRECDGSNRIVARYDFRREIPFEVRGVTMPLTGLEVTLECRRSWSAQHIDVAVSQGVYDHVTRKTIIPNNEQYILGPFNRDKWKEIDAPPPPEDVAPGECSLKMTLLEPVAKVPPGDVPNIAVLIAERIVS